MFNKLKQVKDMRQKAKRMQGMLKEETVVGEAAHGKVKIAMSGNQEALAVTIDPAFQQSESAEKMGSAVKDAINDAVKKAQRVMVKKMQESGDLKL
jgi:DNA-binding YbaB/EbfC family protein